MRRDCALYFTCFSYEARLSENCIKTQLASAQIMLVCTLFSHIQQIVLQISFVIASVLAKS